MIAEEWDLPYEEVDQWPTQKVDYWYIRMQGTGALREEQREEAEAKYAEENDLDTGDYEPGMEDRPDSVSEHAWEHMTMKQRRGMLQNTAMFDERELEQHLEIMEERNNEPERQ